MHDRPSLARAGRVLVAAALAALAALAGCKRPQPAVIAPQPPENAPPLVVMVVVDQMRADYLDRFRPLFTGGFARLLDQGVSFANTHHDHAVTVTAAGHATLSTGTHPSEHGVVDNYIYDRKAKEEVAAVSDPEFGRSPRVLLRGTLGDALKTVFPAARVIAIAGKDRSAILLAGGKADAAYYYDRRSGGFTTTRYYRSEGPTWLQELNRQRYLDRFFGTAWTPLVPTEQLASFGVAPLDWGFFDRSFPKMIGGLALYPNQEFYDAISSVPMMDEYTIEAAKAAIDGEGLGMDKVPDFLGIGLSAVDAVGHNYGPDSPELVDALVRVDRALGGLLAYLDRKFGEGRVLVTLSSDHGVPPVPELAAARGQDGRRLDAEQLRCVQRIGKLLDERFGPERWFSFGFYLDRELVAAKGQDPLAITRAAAEAVAACPRVARAWAAADLMSDPEPDEFERLYRNSYHDERSPDVIVQLVRNTLWTTELVASHGMPYEDDTHVPWLLLLPSGERGTVTQRVATRDVAPTLAPYIGLDLSKLASGSDRRSLLAGLNAPAHSG